MFGKFTAFKRILSYTFLIELALSYNRLHVALLIVHHRFKLNMPTDKQC